MHTDDARYPVLKHRYNENSGWHCLWLCTESKSWGDTCLTLGQQLCPDGLLKLIAAINPFFGARPAAEAARAAVVLASRTATQITRRERTRRSYRRAARPRARRRRPPPFAVPRLGDSYRIPVIPPHP